VTILLKFYFKKVHDSYLININKISSLKIENDKTFAKMSDLDNLVPISESEVTFIQVYLENNYNLPFHSL